jgi:hypothetical protein
LINWVRHAAHATARHSRGAAVRLGLFTSEVILMTDSNKWHNPSEDYPASRPGRSVFFGAAAVCAVGAVVVNWAAISTFAHVQEIKTALGF